ncbi:MAG TPA: hypothetical protein VFH27_18495 [Longimicrobiaceae bacterium]|nr:hypothetical protein [Longimicrobiaceae bacterium]
MLIAGGTIVRVGTVDRRALDALGVPHKGQIATGRLGGVVVLGRDDLAVVNVVSRGVPLVEDGRLVAREAFLDISDREIHMVGTREQDG